MSFGREGRPRRPGVDAVTAAGPFDRLTAQARLVAAIQEGLSDLDAGRVVSDDEVGRRLDARFGAPARVARKK